MSRQDWTPLISACVVAALAWNCAGGSSAAGTAPAPVTQPAPPPKVVPPTPPPVVTAAPPASAEALLRSSQSGVYTDEQATQGREVFATLCASCHSGDLVGTPFKRNWVGKPLAHLYGLMVETMPQDDPGSLARDDYVRVIAYLLKANGNPAGDAPLPTDSLALAKIRLDTLSTKR